MTEYTKADGTIGYVNYDDNIILEGGNADYHVQDPTWKDKHTKKTVKGYTISGHQDGFSPFTRYQSFCMGRDDDLVMPSLGFCTGQLTPLGHLNKSRRKSSNFGHLRQRGDPERSPRWKSKFPHPTFALRA
eukprot:11448461-Karenia_brevis.AAC.1